jgi:hypothetical protein
MEPVPETLYLLTHLTRLMAQEDYKNHVAAKVLKLIQGKGCTHSTLPINTASRLKLESPGLQSEWFRNLQKDDIPPLRLISACILLKGMQ